MTDADIFIGVSVPGIVTEDMVRSMRRDAIVFAMANPVPEIMPDKAKAAGARVVGTGRSDFPNQVNNVLVFPGMFRGALANALAELVAAEELNDDFILPKAFDGRVGKAVAVAVAQAAKSTGVSRI